MGVPNQLEYWTAIHAETLMNAVPPYRGINLMTVKKEKLQALLDNLRKQTEYVEKMGGTMAGFTMREHDDHFAMVWCFDYPEGFSWDNPDMVEESKQNNGPVVAEWHELSDTYYWYCLESGTRPFPSSIDDIHRQVPPPTAEKMEEIEQLLKAQIDA